MKKILMVVISTTLTAFAGTYPVDDVIDGLRDRATHLETLKNAFEKNRCSIELDDNLVGISPGALRSEGLVMAVSAEIKGNYFAYHKAPSPDVLTGLLTNPAIVSGQLAYKLDDTFSGLVITVNEPKFDSGLSFYEKKVMFLPFVNGKLNGEIHAKSQQGKRLTLRCLPL